MLKVLRRKLKRFSKNFLINILNILSYFGLIKRSCGKIHAKSVYEGLFSPVVFFENFLKIYKHNIFIFCIDLFNILITRKLIILACLQVINK
ncbi:hypothetical protein AJ877_04420 [Campylobacter jejuni]|nr:hypothetical protein AJ877_04420 [Campylobacter jejuni]